MASFTTERQRKQDSSVTSKAYRQSLEKLSQANKVKLKQLAFNHQQLLFEPCSSTTLITAARHLTPQDYTVVLQERTNSSLCAYPLCTATTKVTRSAYKVNVDTKSAVKCSEDPVEFCSRECMKASRYFAYQIDSEPVFMRKKTACDVVLLDIGLVEVVDVVMNGETMDVDVESGDAMSCSKEKMLIQEYATMTLVDSDTIRIKENLNPIAEDQTFDAMDAVEGYKPTHFYSSAQPAVSVAARIRPHPEEISDERIEDLEEQEEVESDSESEHSDEDEYAKDWFQDDDDEQDTTKPTLSRFGRLWIYFNHLVTTDTKLYLQNASNPLLNGHKSTQQPIQPSGKINQTRRAIMSTTLLKTYNRFRREYGLNVLINDVVVGLVGTFLVNGEVLVGVDELCVCIVVMRMLSKGAVKELGLSEEIWREMIQKAQFGIEELDIFAAVFE